jgi:hypothetical protein
MSDDIRLLGLEFILDQCKDTHISFNHVQKMLNMYERHYEIALEAFKYRGCNSDSPELAKIESQQYIRKIIHAYKIIIDEGTPI